VIAVENLAVRFGGVRPIDNLTATLDAPICGLIGPNGAGKTTLLNVLSGFVRPETGSVLVDGVEVIRLAPIERVRMGLRRSFQTEQVVEDLTVRENLAAVADHTVTARNAAAEVDLALRFCGLSAVADLLGRRLNLYQRRLVEMGKCVIGHPRIVLLDEPAAGLSTEESNALSKLILSVPGRFGAQVLVIDHDVEFIRALCSHTLVIDYGKMLAVGPTEEVLARPEVRRAYLGEF
jgi:branched-chain amino acid transport system ATP-binding protein